MSSKTFKHPPIYPGFPWEISLTVSAPTPLFPEGSTFKADFRPTAEAPVVFSISSEDGGITRVDDTHLSISVPGEKTAGAKPGFILFDIVRTDTPKHLGIRVQVPVVKSVTQPDA